MTNIRFSQVGVCVGMLLSILIAVFAGALVGGIIAVFVITQLWGTMPMWMVRGG